MNEERHHKNKILPIVPSLGAKQKILVIFYLLHAFSVAKISCRDWIAICRLVALISVGFFVKGGTFSDYFN